LQKLKVYFSLGSIISTGTYHYKNTHFCLAYLLFWFSGCIFN